MVIAMFCFVANDTFVKIVGSSLPVGEIVALRGAMAALIVGAVAARQGVLGSLPLLFSGHVFWRAMLDLTGTLLFVTALMHMEIATLTAVLQVVPLATALFAAVFLKERIGWRRTTAIVLGFVGVMLIVRPTPASFTPYDAMAFAIVFAMAVRDLITRRIPPRVPTLIVALANALFVTIGGFLLALTQGFTPPELWQLACLAAAACFLACGYMFMVETLRLGSLGATAPFRYSIMVFSIISGVAVFSEYPDSLAIAGMALIVATSLYAAHRERLRKAE